MAKLTGEVFMTVRIPRALYRKIELQAKETERSNAGLVRWVLLEYFENQPEEDK